MTRSSHDKAAADRLYENLKGKLADPKYAFVPDPYPPPDDKTPRQIARQQRRLDVRALAGTSASASATTHTIAGSPAIAALQEGRSATLYCATPPGPVTVTPPAPAAAAAAPGSYTVTIDGADIAKRKEEVVFFANSEAIRATLAHHKITNKNEMQIFQDIQSLKNGDSVTPPDGMNDDTYKRLLDQMMSHYVMRGVAKQYFEFDGAVIDPPRETPLYYACFPNLGGGETQDLIDLCKKTGSEYTFKPNGAQHLKEKYKAIILQQLMVASLSGDLGVDIVTPNAFLQGLTREDQTIAKKMFAEAAMEAAQQFEPPANAKSCPILLLHESTEMTRALTEARERDIAFKVPVHVGKQDAAAANRILRDTKQTGHIATCIMGDGRQPFGNGVFRDAANSAAEENFSRVMLLEPALLFGRFNELTKRPQLTPLRLASAPSSAQDKKETSATVVGPFNYDVDKMSLAQKKEFFENAFKRQQQKLKEILEKSVEKGKTVSVEIKKNSLSINDTVSTATFKVTVASPVPAKGTGAAPAPEEHEVSLTRKKNQDHSATYTLSPSTSGSLSNQQRLAILAAQIKGMWDAESQKNKIPLVTVPDPDGKVQDREIDYEGTTISLKGVTEHQVNALLEFLKAFDGGPILFKNNAGEELRLEGPSHDLKAHIAAADGEEGAAKPMPEPRLGSS